MIYKKELVSERKGLCVGHPRHAGIVARRLPGRASSPRSHPDRVGASDEPLPLLPRGVFRLAAGAGRGRGRQLRRGVPHPPSPDRATEPGSGREARSRQEGLPRASEASSGGPPGQNPARSPPLPRPHPCPDAAGRGPEERPGEAPRRPGAGRNRERRAAAHPRNPGDQRPARPRRGPPGKRSAGEGAASGGRKADCRCPLHHPPERG